jgi:hypothetical protein
VILLPNTVRRDSRVVSPFLPLLPLFGVRRCLLNRARLEQIHLSGINPRFFTTAKPAPGRADELLLSRAIMVIVTQRRRRKLQSNSEKQHDFSQDKDRCAKCGMSCRVWNDTRVPCPEKPYSTSEPVARG